MDLPEHQKQSVRIDGSHEDELGRTSSIRQLTKRNVAAIAELEQAASAQRGTTDRIADAITRFVGSMAFVYFHLLWFAGWIAFNTLALMPSNWRVDPFPFTFLTFIVSLEAIFLSTFILISQNHEEHLAQRRSHLDLQVNLLSEQENSKMLQMLEAIQRKLGIEVDDHAKRLEEDTRPSELAKEIEDVIESGS
jgi:uncharacterized membrane protein